MEIFIEKQLINIAYSLILGLIFGGIYDIIRVVHIFCGIASYSGEAAEMKRGVLPFGIFFLLDTAYMLTVTTAFSVFIYVVNNGGFRMYLLVSTVVGMVVYFLTVGRLVMLLSETIVNFLGRLFDLVIVKPIRSVLRLLGRAFGWVYSHTVGYLLLCLRRMNGYRYTEKIRRRIAREIMFEAEERGRDR